MIKDKIIKIVKHSILVTTIAAIVAIAVIVYKANIINYEYYKDGNFGKSKECYQNDKQDCLCKIDGNFISVESYYEVE